MKVMHIINITTYGGAENLLPPFLYSLSEKGVKVHCAILCPISTPDAARNIKKDLIERGVSVFYKEFHSPWKRDVFTWVKKMINDNEIDLVHCHLRHAEMWVYLLKLFGKVATPAVTTAHGYRDSYMNQYGLRMIWKEYFKLYYWASRLSTSGLDGIIYISNCMSGFYRDAKFDKGKPSETIYHGYSSPLAELPLKAKVDGLRKPKLVHWGRLVKRKGQTYSIEAFKLIKNQYPEAELHFYGIGVMENKLRKLVQKLGLENAVFFHGYKNNILQEVQQYDIALLPSFWEPFGLVYLDAFAIGLPIVSFDMPAGNEVIANEEDGLLAKPLDSTDLSEKILRLFNDQNLKNRLIFNGREKLKLQFSMSAMADKYIAFYKKLL